MSVSANPIEHLSQTISRLPGFGPRSARRMVLKLLREREKLLRPLIESLTYADQNIVSCTQCGNLDGTDPCSICNDPRRDASQICVVEDLADLWAMERSSSFRGSYHVLGGVLSAIDGIGPDKLRVHTLCERAAQDIVNEVIIATNQTVDGQATAHYLTDALQESNVHVSQLAQGVPLGGELDYLDDGTLGAAFRERKAFS